MRIANNPKNSFRNAADTAAKSGKGLSVGKVNDYLRFSVFLVIIGMAYIANSYRAERFIKQKEELRSEVKALKSRYLLRQATMGAGTRFLAIRAEADSLGLRALREPAYKLVRGLHVPLSKLDTPRRDIEERMHEIERQQDSLRAQLDSTQVALNQPPG